MSISDLILLTGELEEILSCLIIDSDLGELGGVDDWLVDEEDHGDDGGFLLSSTSPPSA
jgi:hypothetical protein